MKLPQLSEQLWATIGGIIVVTLITFVPALEPMQENINVIVGMIIAAIAGKTAQNYAEVRAAAPPVVVERVIRDRSDL